MKKDLSIFDNMPIYKTVFKNIVPSIVSMVMVLIYNMADMFFIGLTNDPFQVAAISISTPLFLIFMSFGMMFGIGGISVISRAFGEKKYSYAKNLSSFCFWGSVIVGIVFIIVYMLFMDNILKIIGTSNETVDYVNKYLIFISLGSPFIIISASFSNILRAEGQATKAMIGMILGNVINVILDPIFILFLDMDVSGAAIATVLSNIISTSFYILHFTRGNSSLSIKISDFKIKNKVLTAVFAIGIPASLNGILMSTSNIILNNQISKYGDLQVAAIGVAMKIMMFVVMIQIGLGQGIQPLLGYYYGAKNKKRFKGVLSFSLMFSILLCFLMTAFCYLFSNQLVSVFLENKDAFNYGVQFTYIQLRSGFILGILFVLTATLQAIGAAVPSLILSISKQGLIYIPVLLILGYNFGLKGLVSAQPTADYLTALLAIFLYFLTNKEFISSKNINTNQICNKTE
jgi:putative MATE family efflux protein